MQQENFRHEKFHINRLKSSKNYKVHQLNLHEIFVLISEHKQIVNKT